jgi:UDP-glucose 4-epimerase
MTTTPQHRVHSVAGRRILVTGGAGFIGSHLVDALLARGAAHVTVLDSMRFANASHAGRDAGRTTVVKHVLGTDPVARLDERLDGVDLVFHLAAEKHNQSLPTPDHLFFSNVNGTQGLFDAAGRAGVKKIVFSSSLYACGRTSGPPLTETEAPRPRTLYGISKLAGEHILDYARDKHGLRGVALRYFFTYGPRQFPGTGYKSVIVSNFERLRAGARPVVRGDGRQVLDYVFVDDVVGATIDAMELDVDGEIINVGSGLATQVADLTAAMIEVSGRDLAPEPAAADWTAGTSRVADIAKAQRLLGWRPTTSLRDGLRRTYQWMLDNDPTEAKR